MRNALITMNLTRIYYPLFIIPFILGGLSCKDQKNSTEEIAKTEEEIHSGNSADKNKLNDIITIQTKNMDIIMPDTLNSGWNTFQYKNDSEMVHLILVDKLPIVNGEQIRVEDLEGEIGHIFQEGMDLITEGKKEEGFAEFEKFPEWITEIVYTGGIGLVSEGETAQTTFKLQPGVYAFECYVKTGGQFHTGLGMFKEVVVTEQESITIPPTPDLTITLSSEGGIKMDEKIKPGLQIIEVIFKDQMAHEHMLGHDLNLVKLEESTNMQELEKWMNWIEPKGLETSTEPAVFLGGIQDMPKGNIAYVKFNFEPGTYAFISEVPDAAEKNMLKIFKVSEKGD